jgi:hypothetical protein
MAWKNMVSDLIPYIAGAAALALAIDYVAPPFEAGLHASMHTSLDASSTPTQIVDRSHKGDRLTLVGARDEMRLVAGDADASTEAMSVHRKNQSRLQTPSDQSGDAGGAAVPANPSASKPRLPIGCDPAFSPLTKDPANNLAARCLSSLETGTKLTALHDPSRLVR